MSNIVVTCTQRICALCKYWNGTIGSTTIKVQPGAHSFQIDNQEQKDCFKAGVGMRKIAMQSCSYFKPRYEE